MKDNKMMKKDGEWWNSDRNAMSRWNDYSGSTEKICDMWSNNQHTHTTQSTLSKVCKNAK